MKYIYIYNNSESLQCYTIFFYKYIVSKYFIADYNLKDNFFLKTTNFLYINLLYNKNFYYK